MQYLFKTFIFCPLPFPLPGISSLFYLFLSIQSFIFNLFPSLSSSVFLIFKIMPFSVIKNTFLWTHLLSSTKTFVPRLFHYKLKRQKNLPYQFHYSSSKSILLFAKLLFVTLPFRFHFCLKDTAFEKEMSAVPTVIHNSLIYYSSTLFISIVNYL